MKLKSLAAIAIGIWITCAILFVLWFSSQDARGQAGGIIVRLRDLTDVTVGAGTAGQSIIRTGSSGKVFTITGPGITVSGNDGSTLLIGSGGTLGSAAFTTSTAYEPTGGSLALSTVGVVTTGTWNATALSPSQITGTAAVLGNLTAYTGTADAIAPSRVTGTAAVLENLLAYTGTADAIAPARVTGTAATLGNLLAYTGTADAIVPSRVTGTAAVLSNLLAYTGTADAIAPARITGTAAVLSNLLAYTGTADAIAAARITGTAATLGANTFTGTQTIGNVSITTAGAISTTSAGSISTGTASFANGQVTISAAGDLVPKTMTFTGNSFTVGATGNISASSGLLATDANGVRIFSNANGTSANRLYWNNVTSATGAFSIAPESSGTLQFGVDTPTAATGSAYKLKGADLTASGTAGATSSITIAGGNALVTSGTGGDVVLLPGLGSTSGGNILLNTTSAGNVAGTTRLSIGPTGLTTHNSPVVFAAGGTAAGTAPLKLTTQANGLGTVEQGAMELIGNSLQFTQLAKRRGVAMTQGVITSDLVAVGSTNEIIIVQAAHGANYLETGKMEELVAYGSYSQRNNPAATTTLRVRVGTAGTIADGTAFTVTTPGSSATTGTPQCMIRVANTCRSTGTGGTIVINGLWDINGFNTDPASWAPSATVDTTAAHYVTVTLQLNEANAANSFNINQARVLCIENNK